MKNLGDFAAKQIVRGSFNSRSTSGAPITLAGTPSLVCYKNNGTTEQTGVTLNVDFDSRTGYHIFEIDTDDAFYQKNCDYSVVIAAGTVDSVSVVGVEVGFFSIENRSEEIIRRNAFVATDLAIGTVISQTEFVLTGGPTNDVANVMAIFADTSESGAQVVAEGSYVGSTGTLTLTAVTPITVTTSDTVTLVAVAATGSVTLADGAITAAKFGASAITSTVLADGVITAAKIATDAITDAKVATDVVTAIQSGLATASSLATVAGYLDTEIAAILANTNELQTDWANGGRLDLILDTAASGLDEAGVRAAVGLASANLDTQLAALPTAAENADAVWDEATSGHATAGSYGASVIVIGVEYIHTNDTTAETANVTITKA